jgi:hypothetical protein
MNKEIKLNITADLSELREYYGMLKTQYNQYKWIATEQKDNIKREAYNSENIDLSKMASGYAITTYLPEDDNRLPAPWNVIAKLTTDGKKRTEMCFGIAERVMDKIPMAYRLGISVTPGGNYIESHTDDAWHIHFPIYSPLKSYFTWDDENRNPVEWSHYPADGFSWALNTQLMHSVKNQDTEDRVHMFFSVKEEDIPALLQLNLHI